MFTRQDTAPPSLHRALPLLLAALGVGCGSSVGPPDARADAASSDALSSADGREFDVGAPLTDGGTDAAVSDAGEFDAGEFDAGASSTDGGADVATGDAREFDAGPVGSRTLTQELGCFFTASASEPARVLRVGEVGTAYQRLEVEFDVVVGSYRPHVTDPSNRTEHILLGLFRANQPQSWQRYLGGVAAVDFETRAPHFRMFGRDEIAMGFMSYASDSGVYRWREGARYTVNCVFDATAPAQTCSLATEGAIVAERALPVPYLDGTTHLSTAFDVHLGTDNENEIEVSPYGWQFCDLMVRGTL